MRTIHTRHSSHRKSKDTLLEKFPPFSLSTAEYYHTKFLSSLTPNATKKTQKNSNRNAKIIPTTKVHNHQ